jgi:xanthine dehydrogenase iron-sulfur cluster and FAD-binding subunit A
VTVEGGVNHNCGPDRLWRHGRHSEAGLGGEAALVGKDWTEATVEAAPEAMAGDFTPMSDMRASSGYRMLTAQNLLRRYFHDLNGRRRFRCWR